MIISSHLTSFGGLALTLTVAILPSMAVKYGDTITNKTVLNANLICTCADYPYSAALNLKAPATLDLNGQTVSCSDSDETLLTCLTISGKGSVHD